MHIAHHRKRYDWHGKRLRRAKRRFALLCRRWIERATDDETRCSRLWAASVRAVKMGLWKYPVSKQGPCSRFACYAILRIWCQADGAMNARFGWHNWLHTHGWTACGEESDKFRKKLA